LQRKRDSLEKQHQEAEDFLGKMREKKMKDLELWKQKHQRMRERHLQQVSIVLKGDFNMPTYVNKVEAIYIYVYARPFIHCPYFIYPLKFHARTHAKIKRQYVQNPPLLPR